MNTFIPRIDQISRQFEDTFGHLDNNQLNWRPDAQTWSIAQNIDHLIVLNKTYWPVIESLENGSYRKPWLGNIGFIVSFLGKFLLKSVSPDRKQKIKTFPIWEPGSSSIDEGILKRFVQHQQALQDLIQRSSGLMNQGAVISSPANRHIVYTLETAFDIIITHEERHLQQAKELLNLLKQHT